MTFICIYGDSLSLPRAGDGVPPQMTYAEILRQELADRGVAVTVLNRSRGGATIEELYRDFRNDVHYLGDSPEQVLIIQCGIVDCAPRPLSRRGRAVVSHLPALLRTRVISFLHARRATLLRRGIAFRYTRPSRFASTLERWLGEAAKHWTRILVINIAPTNEATERHSPGLSGSIDLFNRLIAEAAAAVPVATVIDVHRMISTTPSLLARCINERDGHHITAEGHRLFADAVNRALPPS